MNKTKEAGNKKQSLECPRWKGSRLKEPQWQRPGSGSMAWMEWAWMEWARRVDGKEVREQNWKGISRSQTLSSPLSGMGWY